jgi:hypothetical protein
MRGIVQAGTAALLALLAGAGCVDHGDARGLAGDRSGAPPVHIDSIFPIEEEIARFRATLAEAPEALAGGAQSREELVRRYVGALEAADTAEIRRLALSRSEFGHLYYPTTRFTRPPYELSPALLWFQIESHGSRGIVRALNRYSGQRMGYVSHRCDPEPEVEGENRVWSGCLVEIERAPGDTVALRLFGQVLERDGRFKFVSLANAL